MEIVSLFCVTNRRWVPSPRRVSANVGRVFQWRDTAGGSASRIIGRGEESQSAATNHGPSYFHAGLICSAATTFFQSIRLVLVLGVPFRLSILLKMLFFSVGV